MLCHISDFSFFFFNDTATTEIYTLSLHDALPIFRLRGRYHTLRQEAALMTIVGCDLHTRKQQVAVLHTDRKSTRLNSSHANISYAVFCLKKKKFHILYSTIPS